MTNRRGRRSTKKKHDMPLTEEMLNELNKNSLGGYGHGMGHGAGGMTERHHSSAMDRAGYDNYGQDPDDFYDMEDVWNNDRYNFGQNKYKVFNWTHDYTSSDSLICDSMHVNYHY